MFRTQQWLGGNRLFIGISASHPAPLSPQDRARGATPRVPTVIGYAANVKNAFDFIGGYRYQEPLLNEVGIEFLMLSLSSHL